MDTIERFFAGITVTSLVALVVLVATLLVT